MTDIVLKDADPVLFDRIRRVADARGWTLPRALNGAATMTIEPDRVRYRIDWPETVMV